MPNRQSKATILEVGNHRFFWCNSLPQPSDLFIIIVSQFPSDIPLPATLTSTSRWLALTIHCYAWPCLIYDAYDLIYDECNCVTWFLMIMILQPPFWMIHLYRFIYIYIYYPMFDAYHPMSLMLWSPVLPMLLLSAILRSGDLWLCAPGSLGNGVGRCLGNMGQTGATIPEKNPNPREIQTMAGHVMLCHESK